VKKFLGRWMFLVTGNKRFLGAACYRLLVICEKNFGPALTGYMELTFLGVRFCVRWMTLLYMIGL
jgi:hypothetical protein